MPLLEREELEEVVKRVSKLAMLRLSDEEVKAFARDFERILAWFRQLDELDLRGVEPLYHPHGSVGRLRADVEGEGMLTHEEVERSLKKPIERGFIKVPWRGG